MRVIFKIFFVLLAIRLFTCEGKVKRDVAEFGRDFVPKPKVEEVSGEDLSEETPPPTDASPLLAANYYFIFDGSENMEERCAGQEKLRSAQRAAQELIEQVPDDANMGLLVFDDHRDRGEAFTEPVALGPDNRKKMNRALRRIDADGNSSLREAIYQGVNQLEEQSKKQQGYGEYHLVIITDGQDIGLEDAARYAVEKGIAIHTVGLCIDREHPLRTYALSFQNANERTDFTLTPEAERVEPETFEPIDTKTLVAETQTPATAE
ncbi:von Willebrand factor type A domain-containing protein [Catalinimonas alkaloidigena]|uniref:von Willebrand factor type A domain-containing protein n=1 Tax=Catalinimonas alkaloidigena TaxID=1075417 RepID=A0A1G9EB45_9BACT|nr:vWA domain-containing protein [Catalinimonas alkaloidigena]SDK73334.1 von Willebrand factor type A domain-containing protein [Catalinimonas alkaloidigena]